jgi:single-strand DNA-binding protein
MASMNKVLLMGNLTRDPELRYTPGGSAVAEFGIAVNRTYKGQDGSKQEEATFVEITAWGRTAELAKQYLGKGRRVFIEGRLKFDQWTSPEGQKRSKLSVVCENLQFMESRGDRPEGGPPGQGGGNYRSDSGGERGGFGGGPSGQAQEEFGSPGDYGGGFGGNDSPPF